MVNEQGNGLKGQHNLAQGKRSGALISIFARTVFLLHSLPRAAFRFVPPSTLPWATPILPLQGEEKASSNLCIKSSPSEGGVVGTFIHRLIKLDSFPD